MFRYKILITFIIVLELSCYTLAQDEDEADSRSLRKRLCKKFGICQGGGHHGGFHGGYHGQGFPGQGYPGHGYSGQFPPINIGISQSQSSSSAGGGGYGQGYYPNNYQYNQNRPGYGGGYFPNQGFGNYPRPGYNSHNGFGGYNQYNGNYYNSHGGFGGFGFGGPLRFDDYDNRPQYDEPEGTNSVVNDENKEDIIPEPRGKTE